MVSRPDADFRNVKWGDSPEIVMFYERADFMEKSTSTSLGGPILGYSTKINRFDAYLVYDFDDDNRLFAAGYYLNESHTSASMYISDYNSLKDILTLKYGAPYDSGVRKDDIAAYTDDAGALQLGLSVYRTLWETDTTEIMLGMMRDNWEYIVIIGYESKKIQPLTNTDGF
jgi:hypothetical protein